MYNPYKVVDKFEKMIALWAGAKYGIAVESGTAALFLSCVYKKVKEVIIPKYTYPSVPCSIIHAGGWVKFSDTKWKGVYELKPYKIYDSALRFKPGMYKGGLHCLSFHMKKHLPIGRGGMILTDDRKAYNWFKRARFDGRRELPLEEDNFNMLGWNCYMTPEQASRGIMLFSTIDQKGNKDLETNKQGYPDLSKYNVYKTRKAKTSDCKRLFKWKNESTVRKYSIETQEEIDWEDHLEWFEKHKDSIFIIEDELPYGDIRFDGDEIAIKIDRKYRGMGIGKKVLELAKELKDTMIAKIVDGNVASMNLFLNAGFKIVDHRVENKTGYYILKYEL